MKKILALACLFGTILIPTGLLWLGFLLAPQEFILNRNALVIDQGRLRDSKALLPDFTVKEPFQYPGTLAGLTGRKDDDSFWLLVCKNVEEAKSVFKSYAREATKDLGVHQSSGPGYHHYKNPRTGNFGRIKLIDEIILHIEGKDEERLDHMFMKSGILVPNPKANILTEIFQTDKLFNKYLWHFLVLVLIYVGLLFPIWNRVTAWATTVRPKPGVIAVEESELRRRLLTINDLNVPLEVSQRKSGKIDVTWRLADAKWAGLMTANKVTEVRIIRLKLSNEEKVCRAVDIIKSVRATADGLALSFSFNTFFSRGVIFGEWAYEKQYGLIFKDGRLTFDTIYEYQFSYDELNSPVVNIVTQSGWQYKQVLF